MGTIGGDGIQDTAQAQPTGNQRGTPEAVKIITVNEHLKI